MGIWTRPAREVWQAFRHLDHPLLLPLAHLRYQTPMKRLKFRIRHLVCYIRTRKARPIDASSPGARFANFEGCLTASLPAFRLTVMFKNNFRKKKIEQTISKPYRQMPSTEVAFHSNGNFWSFFAATHSAAIDLGRRTKSKNIILIVVEAVNGRRLIDWPAISAV